MFFSEAKLYILLIARSKNKLDKRKSLSAKGGGIMIKKQL